MSQSERISDEQLLQRHLDGDGEAFTALVERYRDELFNFLARFVSNRTLAEDVFQDAFLQLHVSAGRFDMSRRLKPWLFAIAANKARDSLRSRGRRQAVSLDVPLSSDGGGRSSYGDLIPSNIPAPDETSLNLERSLVVENIIRQMPETLRTVLLLCYFNDFAYKEIAAILEIPLGTVKSRLHSALRHFARIWQETADRSEYDEPQT